MKHPLMLTSGIIAVFTLLGWRGQQELAELRQEHQQAVSRFRDLGGQEGDFLNSAVRGKSPRSIREVSPDRIAKVKSLAARYVAFRIEQREAMRDGTPQENFGSRSRELTYEMLQLDPGEMKLLISELRRELESDSEMSAGLIRFAILTHSSSHPLAALKLLQENPGIDAGVMTKGEITATALANLAKSDPTAAVEWIRNAPDTEIEAKSDLTKLFVVKGAASHDPALAFSLISELGFSEDSMPYTAIAETAMTAEARSEVLAAMRSAIEKTKDPVLKKTISDQILRTFGSAANSDYEGFSAWVEAAHLSPAELKQFTASIDGWKQNEEPGKWLDWMEDKIPADQFASKVNSMIIPWASADYRAAGDWIRDTAEGPTKDAAIGRYAAVVSQQQPEAAAQWAISLPSGNARSEALKTIYRAWRSTDASAAEAFARKNGL